VTLPTVLGPWTLVFHPDGVRHVVQENHFNYRKGGISHQALRLRWAMACSPTMETPGCTNVA
jgi:hypothetical protein